MHHRPPALRFIRDTTTLHRHSGFRAALIEMWKGHCMNATSAILRAPRPRHRQRRNHDHLRIQLPRNDLYCQRLDLLNTRTIRMHLRMHIQHLLGFFLDRLGMRLRLRLPWRTVALNGTQATIMAYLFLATTLDLQQPYHRRSLLITI